jgi:hypothetical protein
VNVDSIPINEQSKVKVNVDSIPINEQSKVKVNVDSIPINQQSFRLIRSLPDAVIYTGKR